jgi:hypothetical protein
MRRSTRSVAAPRKTAEDGAIRLRSPSRDEPALRPRRRLASRLHAGSAPPRREYDLPGRGDVDRQTLMAQVTARGQSIQGYLPGCLSIEGLRSRRDPSRVKKSHLPTSTPLNRDVDSFRIDSLEISYRLRPQSFHRLSPAGSTIAWTYEPFQPRRHFCPNLESEVV